jgi:hypothetical protein
MSAGHDTVLTLLDAKQQKAAQAVFAATVLPNAQNLLKLMPQTYPERFKGINDWCSWIKALEAQAVKADKALAGTDAAEADKAVAAVREQFCKLRQEIKKCNTGDVIALFRITAAKDKPAAADLQALRDAMEKASPSIKAKAEADAYAKARAAWAAKIDPILKDGTVDEKELAELRSATETFYRAFGAQYE